MRLPASLLLLAIAAAGAAHGQATAPFSASEQLRNSRSSPAGCSFAGTLPEDVIVVAAGGYSGRRRDFQIDQSGDAATQFDVGVHADRPVALLLGAYEPTVWSIGWTEGTRIVAVFATGYHRQVVAGLPDSVPVISSSHDEGSPCGHNYVGNDTSLGWVNPKSRTVFGAEALRVYNRARDGVFDINESARPKTAYVTSPAHPPSSFRAADTPLAGTAGLDAAVAAGTLRRLTPADVERVKEHYRTQARQNAPASLDVPPIAGRPAGAPAPLALPSFDPGRSYVVLKPFVFPAGLYGAHLAYFLVPPGVPAPTGNPGHSMVIDLNKPVPCAGPLCRSLQ